MCFKNISRRPSPAAGRIVIVLTTFSLPMSTTIGPAVSCIRERHLAWRSKFPAGAPNGRHATYCAGRRLRKKKESQSLNDHLQLQGRCTCVRDDICHDFMSCFSHLQNDMFHAGAMNGSPTMLYILQVATTHAIN